MQTAFSLVVEVQSPYNGCMCKERRSGRITAGYGVAFIRIRVKGSILQQETEGVAFA
jgi:hypothetical protein